MNLKIAGLDGRVRVMFAKPGGKPFTLEISPNRQHMIEAGKVLKISCPLYLKKPKTFYWFEYLPDSQALYIQYNVCDFKDATGNSFENFTKKLFAFADSHAVRRVIVDLRLNGGGCSNVIVPLLSGQGNRKRLP